MATGSHPPAQSVEAVSVFSEKRAAEVILRPVVRPGARDLLSDPPSRLPGRGSTGEAAADFSFEDGRYAERLVTGRDQVMLEDGMGAMRGFMLVVGLYMGMGAMGLGGLLLWHWLH